MKKILYILLTVSLSLGFAGCSDDKEDELEPTPPPVEEIDNRPSSGSLGTASTIGEMSVKTKLLDEANYSNDSWSLDKRPVYLKNSGGNWYLQIMYIGNPNWMFKFSYDVKDDPTFKDYFYTHITKPNSIQYSSSDYSASLADNNKFAITKKSSKEIILKFDNLEVKSNYRVYYFTGEISIIFDFDIDKK